MIHCAVLTSTRPSGCSIILPAHNERANLPSAVAALDAAAAAVLTDYEIIIIEDASTDGTVDLADELAASFQHCRVIHNLRSEGYGPALLRGFAAASKDYVFYTDADHQYDYSQFSFFWPRATRYDVLAGYRHRRADPVSRLFFAWAYAWALKTALGFPFRDADCSFKYFRRSAIAGIPLQSQSGFVEAELLLKCRVAGMRIKQMPVKHFPRRAGSVSFELLRAGPLSLVKPGPIVAMVTDILRARKNLPAYAAFLRRQVLLREASL